MELLIAASTVCQMILLMAEKAKTAWLLRLTSCRPCSTAMETALEICSPKSRMGLGGWPSMLILCRLKC